MLGKTENPNQESQSQIHELPQFCGSENEVRRAGIDSGVELASAPPGSIDGRRARCGLHVRRRLLARRFRRTRTATGTTKERERERESAYGLRAVARTHLLFLLRPRSLDNLRGTGQQESSWVRQIDGTISPRRVAVPSRGEPKLLLLLPWGNFYTNVPDRITLWSRGREPPLRPSSGHARRGREGECVRDGAAAVKDTTERPSVVSRVREGEGGPLARCLLLACRLPISNGNGRKKNCC